MRLKGSENFVLRILSKSLGVPSAIKKNAQTAVEYVLLLSIVVIIVLIGFRTFVPRAYKASGVYYNRAGYGILGEPNKCGNLNCETPFEDQYKCCVDCGPPGCGSF